MGGLRGVEGGGGEEGKAHYRPALQLYLLPVFCEALLPVSRVLYRAGLPSNSLEEGQSNHCSVPTVKRQEENPTPGT